MIRKHCPEDLDQIMLVWYKASTLAHPFLDDDFVEMVRDAMQNMYIPGSETWVFEQDNSVVGFISMMDNEIGGLFVLPNHHSKGIGTQLLEFIKTKFKVLEVEVFEENPIGRSFYKKHGFELVKKFLHQPSGHEVLRLSMDVQR